MPNDRLFGDTPNYESAKFPTLRPFQVTAHEKLRQGWHEKHRHQMIMAPTGAGKSVLALNIIHEALKKGKRAMFVCDRTTLIDQTSDVADTMGLGAHGIIQADHWRYEKSFPFQIASAQTLARRNWPETDLVVIDEAHVIYKVVGDYIRSNQAPCIGLSATPFSPGLGLLFTNLINAATMDELTISGVLVPMRVMSCTKVDMRGAETSGGEWTDGSASARGLEIVGDVVSEWAKHAGNLKTIIFGPTIVWCEETCKQFLSAGVEAAVFTSETTKEERVMLLEEYKKPDSRLRVLISVEALAKGFDVKDVECVCDVRPLRKSLSTAIQMWGRGLRSSPETGKKELLLLDFSGNIVRFMADFSDIYYNGLDALDSGEKLDAVVREDDEKQPPKPCPKCGYFPFAKKCLGCGHEIKRANLVEQVPGQMQELMLHGQAYKERIATWEQICTYARANSAPDKQKGRAAHLYKDFYGDWPGRGFVFEATPSVPISKEVMNKIRAKNIAFAKRRR